jgi:hypothetical protein
MNFQCFFAFVFDKYAARGERRTTIVSILYKMEKVQIVCVELKVLSFSLFRFWWAFRKVFFNLFSMQWCEGGGISVLIFSKLLMLLIFWSVLINSHSPLLKKLSRKAKRKFSNFYFVQHNVTDKSLEYINSNFVSIMLPNKVIEFPVFRISQPKRHHIIKQWTDEDDVTNWLLLARSTYMYIEYRLDLKPYGDNMETLQFRGPSND